MSESKCRFCQTPIHDVVVDLGMSPLANSYLAKDQLAKAEAFYPLCARVCHQCLLVQVDELQSPAHIFSDYAYFSSVSESWLHHAKAYCEMTSKKFSLTKASQVIEVASNDGYLLQYFRKLEIPVLGIEPAENVAKVATDKGVPTLVKFFGTQTAQELKKEGKTADLLIGNNVLAHVPDLNDFVKGLKILLKPTGVITMEFPHLLNLLEQNQFDTIYHEHFSYFSLQTVSKIFSSHGLDIFDVEELPTHGGSLRIFAQHSKVDGGTHPAGQMLNKVLAHEERAGMTQLKVYKTYAQKVLKTKLGVWEFMIQAKKNGQSVAGFGAPAKGNTLLNYCGIRSDFMDYVVDDTPAKQGRFLPGTHIPIFSAGKLKETKPNFVAIMPWNFKEEIMQKHSYIKEWGGRFVTFIPEVSIH